MLFHVRCQQKKSLPKSESPKTNEIECTWIVVPLVYNHKKLNELVAQKTKEKKNIYDSKTVATFLRSPAHLSSNLQKQRIYHNKTFTVATKTINYLCFNDICGRLPKVGRRKCKVQTFIEIKINVIKETKTKWVSLLK